ncbi:hypothetical protein [Streptomyces avicenniae]|uniref:hypothetical protein n=1 Tax=Streptomyces avicenniae TaxID=500153 RepID=UPI00069A3B18|nr:hypothetical protein [Streptomyces avicenniae]
MTSFREQYDALLGLPRAAMAARVGEWFPDGMPIQWWNGVLEQASWRVRPLPGRSSDERADGFALGAAFVTVVRGDDDASRVRAGRWALRLAALAVRPGQEGVAVPEELTPDGAVRLALGSLPWPPDEALREDARWRADDELHVPGEPILAGPPTALSELIWTLPALEPLLPHLTDTALRESATVWLRDVLPRLGRTA